MTIADIAARAGVSPSAVSFALNGRPGVSAETRARIVALARELDWRPHPAARALSGGRAGAIGFVLNRPARTLGTDPFIGDLLSGIHVVLTDSRIGMTLLVARDVEEEVRTYRDWARDRRVDGVVVIDPLADDPRTALLADSALPTVVIGSHPSPAGAWPTVWVDDDRAAETLLRYLRALGHRRIGHVAGRPDHEHTAMRTAAVRRFAESGALTWARSVPTDYSTGAAAAATRDMLSEPDPPTALMFENDVLALAGYKVAAEMGLAVPADLSVVSFDDSVLARTVGPAMTCLTKDTVELGARAARLLVEQIDSGARLTSQPGPEPGLSVRDSTAPPRSR
ncbi:LacI family DNA-binding transcriptional regulator [Pseudonocardia sp. HH130630-07]|uniref:LacI family DNA-binding transcriptional regulator n=1 Tax=Pseudonocardia sp. HH130630-07 TaxID=1690815 RepID=UPI000AD73725|nr:LacI family DNA-binding transcriptional regulator [Pseudonocardia sp. HH130630-07]